MSSITATENRAQVQHGTNGAHPNGNHAREYSRTVTVEELATRYTLKPQVVNGETEFHGANFLEAGAEKDGFILNADGTAYDRKTERRYTSREVETLSGLAHNEYAPCHEYSQRNGHANGATNGHSAPKLPPAPKASPAPETAAKTPRKPFDWLRAVIHDYRDESGALLFQVARIGSGDEKRMSQRRPDGRGGWLWKLGDTRRVLYRLPDVLQARRVLICEGEKDADAVNAALEVAGIFGEYCATTAPHGAGKFREEYADALREKAVSVLPDNDAQGVAGADATLRVLAQAGIEAPRVELPDLPHKGGAADFLAAGGTVAQVLALCDAAPKWTPAPDAPEAASTREEKPRFELFTLRDMAKMPRPLWLVRGLLVEKTASVISADSGCFKSFFALDMALCVALGRPFMGREVKQGAAVYVAAEGFFTLSERAAAFAQHHGCELPENFHALKVPVNLGDAATVAAFAAAIEKLAPAVVVLDTLSQCAIGANENDNGQMADFVRGMMALCNRIGAHVTVLHHNGKASGTFRGAGAIKANADAHISLDRPEGDQENTVFVRCEKQRGRPFEPFALRGAEVILPFADEYGDAVTSLVFEPCGDEVAAKVEKHPNAKRADKTRDALMEVFDRCAINGAQFGGVKVGFWKEAVEACDPPPCKQSSFWSYRTSLEKDGIIEQCGTHNNSPLFRRKEATPTTPTTPNWSDWSEPNSTTPEYSNNSNNPLGVGVVGVPSVVSANGVVGVREEKPKTKRRAKNANADSEAYAAPEIAPDESELF